MLLFFFACVTGGTVEIPPSSFVETKRVHSAWPIVVGNTTNTTGNIAYVGYEYVPIPAQYTEYYARMQFNVTRSGATIVGVRLRFYVQLAFFSNASYVVMIGDIPVLLSSFVVGVNNTFNVGGASVLDVRFQQGQSAPSQTNRITIANPVLLVDYMVAVTTPPGSSVAGTAPPGSSVAGTAPPGSSVAGMTPPGSSVAGTAPPGSTVAGTAPPGSNIIPIIYGDVYIIPSSVSTITIGDITFTSENARIVANNTNVTLAGTLSLNFTSTPITPIAIITANHLVGVFDEIRVNASGDACETITVIPQYTPTSLTISFNVIKCTNVGLVVGVSLGAIAIAAVAAFSIRGYLEYKKRKFTRDMNEQLRQNSIDELVRDHEVMVVRFNV